jgi:putative FmdB family regulatory protein
MAIYEYTCGVCDKSVTISRSITDPDGFYECNACDAPLKRVYSLLSVSFRGGGFYSTDK